MSAQQTPSPSRKAISRAGAMLTPALVVTAGIGAMVLTTVGYLLT